MRERWNDVSPLCTLRKFCAKGKLMIDTFIMYGISYSMYRFSFNCRNIYISMWCQREYGWFSDRRPLLLFAVRFAACQYEYRNRSLWYYPWNILQKFVQIIDRIFFNIFNRFFILGYFFQLNFIFHQVAQKKYWNEWFSSVFFFFSINIFLRIVWMHHLGHPFYFSLILQRGNGFLFLLFITLFYAEILV